MGSDLEPPWCAFTRRGSPMLAPRLTHVLAAAVSAQNKMLLRCILCSGAHVEAYLVMSVLVRPSNYDFVLQMLAADILHFLPALSRQLLSALAFACNPPQALSFQASSSSSWAATQYPQPIAMRLLHCILSKATDMAPRDLLSFLLTVLIGGNPDSAMPADGPDAVASPRDQGETGPSVESSIGLGAAKGPSQGRAGKHDAAIGAWAARAELLQILEAHMRQSQAASEQAEPPLLSTHRGQLELSNSSYPLAALPQASWGLASPSPSCRMQEFGGLL